MAMTDPESGAVPLNRRIGLRLRLRRRELGLSQDALAKRAGLTTRRLSLCEQGFRPLSAGELYAVARCLSLPIAAFFDAARSPSEVDVLLDADPDPRAEAEQLIRAFHAIRNDRVRTELFHLIAATGRAAS